MCNKKILSLGMFLLIGIFLIGFISSESTYCCEKTRVQPDGSGGAWCQDEPVVNCDNDFQKAPTSCESTTFCKFGTCYNSVEGTCLPNVPKTRCQEEGSNWHQGEPDDVPQCQLGCCLLGEQAAFVTQTRCTSLSSIYGLETNFRTDIDNELQCIMSANPKVKGACVFERESEKTCRLLAKEECLQMSANPEDIGGFFGFGEGEEINVQFHEDYLCSAPTLGTVCGPSEETTCVEGRDEVYFLDTCGNLANIYWKEKADPDTTEEWNYWTYIKDYSESCDVVGEGKNYDSARRNCGNCDYYSGTTCKASTREERAEHGEYVCKTLGCEFDTNGNGEISDDEEYQHGETWCADTGGASTIKVNPETFEIKDKVYTLSNEDCEETVRGPMGGTIVQINPDSECAELRERHVEIASTENLPGSRYFRMLCYNNEVTIEPCADYRQEVCIESKVGIEGQEFRSAGCRPNAWEDCIAQTNKEDCEDIENRDCMWIFIGFERSVCSPRYAPGFNFWDVEDTENTGNDIGPEDVCGIANEVCVVKEESWLDDSFKCEENCDCLRGGTGSGAPEEDVWASQKITFCQSLGDCGYKFNYFGEEGDLEKYDSFYGKSYTKDM